MAYTWDDIQAELEVGMAQKAKVQNDPEIAEVTIEYFDGTYDVTLHQKDGGTDIYNDYGFDEVIITCEGYGLTPDDFLGEDE